jgi:Transposase IS66 family.
MKRRRVEVNIGELDRLLEGARQAPLSDPDYEKISTALHALVDALAKPRSTEKSSAVLEKKDETSGQPETGSSANPDQRTDSKPPGHGRNGADAFESARKVETKHPQLQSGDRCPECPNGKVYVQKEPKALIRIVGQAPIQATVYHLERLRCNLCGQVFTAEAPEGVGADKYDETVGSMVAQLKYGSGMPFNRLEKLEQRLGVPLPATTQWEIVEEAAEVLKPAHEELLRQAAQGEILHNDDTGMKILKLQRPDGDTRTGVFTSGIVSIRGSDKMALFFTGRQHAGENLADVLKHRASGLSAPIQMCDALSRNAPKLSAGAEALIAFCLSHGRRQFVEVAENFPDECRYVLETLGAVYGVDAEAREQGLSWEARLQLHQEKSGPLMEGLQQWMTEQLNDHNTEPNSGLGKAMKYLLRHWHKLTLFLRQAGAPLDNNICERALKMVVLLRKNALFYRTQHGADVGDLFTSLIHTCDLNKVNSFDYLTELQRHATELAATPSEWMPWNYRDTLARPPGG